MSYSKGVCEHCGGRIEFPTEGVGQTIACPHCKWNTVLALKDAPSVEAGGGGGAGWRKRIFLGFGVVAVIAAAAGAGIYFWLKRAPVESQLPQQSPRTVVVIAPIPAPPPDPWHGLKAGPVSLEQQGDGRLVYAVGTLSNMSDHERFGVKIELDVMDAQGEKIGSATDYMQVMEPGKEWKFKAMVTDRKAAKAKLSDIKEED